MLTQLSSLHRFFSIFSDSNFHHGFLEDVLTVLYGESHLLCQGLLEGHEE